MAKKLCTIELDTMNKALSYLGSRPYQEVNSFLSQLLVEANSTLHDAKEAIEDVSVVEEDKKEDAQDE